MVSVLWRYSTVSGRNVQAKNVLLQSSQMNRSRAWRPAILTRLTQQWGLAYQEAWKLPWNRVRWSSRCFVLQKSVFHFVEPLLVKRPSWEPALELSSWKRNRLLISASYWAICGDYQKFDKFFLKFNLDADKLIAQVISLRKPSEAA